MKIIEKIHEAAADSNRVVFSFEFFPPKSEDGVDNLFERMDRMVVHNPSFCDITWDAGGTTIDLTLEIANKMQNIVCLDTMMHLTCTNMLVEKINHTLHTIKSNGLQSVLALRGDPHMARTNLCRLKVAFPAIDLVIHIRAKYGDHFGITIAGYPEAHPHVIGSDGLATAEGYKKDLEYLKSKIPADIMSALEPIKDNDEAVKSYEQY